MRTKGTGGVAAKKLNRKIGRSLAVRYIICALLYLLFILFWMLNWRDILWRFTETSGGRLAFSEGFLFFIQVAILVVVWVIFTFWYFRRALRYLDDLTDASRQLAVDKSQPIVLPKKLAATEDELNAVRLVALADEQRLQETEQKKNDLIMYLAHDLKTPLTSVIGYLNLLQDAGEALPPELREKYTGIALEKAERLDDLVAEFFDVTRLTLSGMTLQRASCDLSLLLAQMISESEPLLEEGGHTFDMQLEEHVQISCDADKIQRVFENLLRNALAYSYPDTPLCVSLETGAASPSGQPGAKEAVVRFLNQGPTIPAEKLEHLFEQFYRVDTARGTKTGGVGLGLAIAREIVELHGGTIEADSKDEMICFTVRLPLQ